MNYHTTLSRSHSPRTFLSRSTLSAILAFASLAILSSNANAQIVTASPALRFTTQNNSKYTFNKGIVLGYDFQVDVPSIIVTALSLYDYAGTGFTSSHNVGLWNSSGTLLASVTVPMGTDAAKDAAGYRYVTLATPIVLTMGTGYNVGALMNFTSTYQGDAAASSVTNLTTTEGITYVGSRFSMSETLVNPKAQGNPNAYFGGSFEFTPGTAAVPEPSTFVMLLGGAGVFALVQTRRRRAALMK